MANTIHTQEQPKVNCKQVKLETSYRGFSSIDQEMERDIVSNWGRDSNNTESKNKHYGKGSL